MSATTPGGVSATPIQELVEQLVGTPSVNPSLVSGGHGEADMARVVAEWLDRAGLSVRVEDVAPGRPNVIATLPGTGGGQSLILNAHTDTVGVDGMDQPFRASTVNGKLFGRGACDTKGGLAAAMAAMARLAGEPALRGDVVLTAVVDEECGSTGTAAIAGRLRADGAIVIEPSGLRMCTEHMGFAWFTIETIGVAAHGSLPEFGRDAIVAMGSVLTELRRLQERLQEGSRHATLPPGSVHASLIDGGVEMSTYPARCTLRVERRTLPQDTQASLARELDDLVTRAGRDWPDGLSATWRLDAVRLGLNSARGSAVVRALEGGIVQVTGETPEFMSATGWTDAALLDAAGIPTVICGPHGGDHHSPGEWVDLESVDALSRILTCAAREFCR